MTNTVMDMLGNELEVDTVGNVLSVDHEDGACPTEPCPYHRPSVSRLAFADIRYSAAMGLVRVCSHGGEHPDVDDYLLQQISYPMFAKTMERIHDSTCDGCCIDREPIQKPADPGSHRADTSAIPLPVSGEVPTPPVDRPVADSAEPADPDPAAITRPFNILADLGATQALEPEEGGTDTARPFQPPRPVAGFTAARAVDPVHPTVWDR